VGPRIGSVRQRTDKRPASLGHSTRHLATELVRGEGGQTLEKGGPLVAQPTAELLWCPSSLRQNVPHSLAAEGRESALLRPGAGSTSPQGPLGPVTTLAI